MDDDLWLQVVRRYTLAGAPNIQVLVLRSPHSTEHALLMRGGTRAERDAAKDFLNGMLRAGGREPIPFWDIDDVKSEHFFEVKPLP